MQFNPIFTPFLTPFQAMYSEHPNPEREGIKERIKRERKELEFQQKQEHHQRSPQGWGQTRASLQHAGAAAAPHKGPDSPVEDKGGPVITNIFRSGSHMQASQR